MIFVVFDVCNNAGSPLTVWKTAVFVLQTDAWPNQIYGENICTV